MGGGTGLAGPSVCDPRTAARDDGGGGVCRERGSAAGSPAGASGPGRPIEDERGVNRRAGRRRAGPVVAGCLHPVAGAHRRVPRRSSGSRFCSPSRAVRPPRSSTRWRRDCRAIARRNSRRRCDRWPGSRGSGSTACHEVTVEQFASGWKRSLLWQGRRHRLPPESRRPGRPGQSPVFGANVLMLVYGDAFWPTYTDGRQHRPDRHGLDEELHPARDDEFRRRRPGRLLPLPGGSFLATYPQVEGVQVSATEIPVRRRRTGSAAFAPGGPERATARVELRARSA